MVTKFKIFEYGTEIKGLVGNVESAGFYMGVTTGGKIRFRFYESADVNKNLYSQEAIKLDTWYTVVLTYDGSTLKLYCNGVLEDSLECTSKISKSAAPIMIGGNPNAEGIPTSGFFEGVISEMIIMTEPLTEGEVIKSYGETLKHIPTSHKVLYYLKFNSDDGIVCNGAAYKEDGMHFDGSDDYISAGLSSYDFKNTFTIGARVKLNAYSDNEYTIFGNPQSAGFNLFKRKDNKLGISVYDQNTSGYINQYTSFIPELNTWYTLMATYDGTKLSLYVNGEEHTSIETTIGTKVCTTPFMVGVNANLNSKLGGCYLNGVVSDVILIDEAITAEQIKANYSTNVRNIISNKTLIAYDLRGYEGREDGTIVPNKMIKTMWVWLPRFKADTPTSLGMIKTKIVGVNDKAHDAFTLGNEELQGFWVGKYENKTNLILDNIPESILIKSQSNTWTNSNIGNMYNEIKNITLSREKYGFDPNDTKTLDTHMIKNSEWAAISYLTHSKCGISRNGTYVEVQEGNSNTGNESGIYAMAGGVSEFVMGNYNVTTNTNFETLPDTKYFDKYTTKEDYENKKLQHALFETNGIYNNSTMNFIDETNMWLIRDNLFSYSNSTGEANANIGSRSILIVK